MSPMTNGLPCTVDGCNGIAYARGWCSKHYLRWRNHGDVLWQPRAPFAECSVDGCTRTVHGQGLCSMHYDRQFRRGTTDLTRLPAIARFLAKVEVVEECWLWMAELDEDGYGYFWDQRRRHRAHRWSYRYYKWSIPLTLEIDHLCNVRRCVQPNHLEQVTNAENIRRSRLRSLVLA